MADIEETFGVMFIGTMLSMIIYGITTIQAYSYYASYPKGDHEAKALVAGIWILDTLHIALLSHALYSYLISAFGDTLALLQGTWSLYTSIAVNVLVAFIVQCYYTRRIFTLSPAKHKRWILVVIGLSVLAHFFLGIEMVVYLFIKKTFTRLTQLKFRTFLPFLIIASTSDVLIAVALCILLASDRSDFDDTHGPMNTVLVYGINRCVLTSVLAVIQVAISASLPDLFFPYAFGFVIGRLYANSLLATLNARPVMRNMFMGKRTSTSFRIATDMSTSLPHASSQETGTDGSRLIFEELGTDINHSGILPKDTNFATRDGLDYG